MVGEGVVHEFPHYPSWGYHGIVTSTVYILDVLVRMFSTCNKLFKLQNFVLQCV